MNHLYLIWNNYYSVWIHNKMSLTERNHLLCLLVFFFNFNKQRKPTLLLLRICMVKSQNCKKSKLWWSLGPSSLFASSQDTLWALVPISICASTTHTVAWTYARALVSLSRFFFLKIKRNKPNLFSTLFLKSKYI